MDAILTAAAETIARGGLDKASVTAIAERAGVSVGSLYQYYSSKDAIVAALIERHTGANLDALQAAFDRARSMGLREAIEHVVTTMVDEHRSPIQQLLAQEFVKLGSIDWIQSKIDARAGALIAAFLNERRDEIGVPNPEFSAFLLLRAIDMLTHAAIEQRPETLLDGSLVEELSTMVIGYLRERR